MKEAEISIGRLQWLIVQQLESLQRSGMTDLIHREPIMSPPVTPRAAQAAASASVEIPPHVASESSVTQHDSRTDASHSPTGGPHVQDIEMAKRSSPVLEQRHADLAVIQREVAGCRRCEHLACTRTQTVFGVGNALTRLCFLGEAPGADEDRKGEPFVGRAGQLLTDIIQKGMGLQRSDVYILNVLKCRPPDNRTPTDEEVANCREYFERQLAVLQPEFICCLGATAVRALLHKTQSLGRLRGQWFEYGGSRVIVTYHPSYLLRNPAAKKDTWDDLQILMREMGLPVQGRVEDRGSRVEDRGSRI